jgi:Bacterial Ig-like domain/Calx-beta domain
MDARTSVRIHRPLRPRIELLESRHLLTVFQFGSGAPLNAEGNLPAVPTVSNQSGSVTVEFLSPGAPTDQIQVSTNGGTATPGVDYTPVNETLTFNQGAGWQNVVIPILNSRKVGGQETVNLIESYANPDDSTNQSDPVIQQSWTLTIANRADITPPTIQDVTPIVKHHRIVQVVLTFDEPMDAQSVQNASDYSSIAQWLDNATGIHRRPAPVLSYRSATYDAATDTVTLTPTKPLKTSLVYELNFDSVPGAAGASPIMDAQGNALNPGYTQIEFGVGRTLKYQTLIGPMTGNWAVTSLDLSGPGIMILKSGIASSSLATDGNYLYVLGSNPKRSVLTGTIDGNDGWTVVSPNGVKDKAQPWA